MSFATTDNPVTLPSTQPATRRWLEVLLILTVFFIAAGDPAPHVNEPYYLCRLKHFWNPTWCAGDFFLESADTQVVFIWLFGWVTRWLSLAATAWVGRVVVWTLLAWSWQRLSWRVTPRPFAAVLSAALFVPLTKYLNLAGEWVVGGVEAKCFAYVFVLLALRELIDGRWNRVWLLLGAGTAFHPLVGGWSVAVCGGIWLMNNASRPSDAVGNLRSMLPGLIAGGLLGLIGAVPALSLTWSESPDIVAEANRIYVFDRLPHHLSPLTLPSPEIYIRLGGHAALLFLLWIMTRALRNTSGATGSASVLPNAASLHATSPTTTLVPINYIAQFAWGAALLAATGLTIELVLWNHPLAAARLLKYYWFRLTDFAAPMAVSFYATALIASQFKQRRPWAVWTLTAALTIALANLANSTWSRLKDPIPVPPADTKIVDYPAWLDVCDWVAKNTPPDALFLTPRLNLSFKWRTGRPEVANRKDIPQNARDLVEWNRRVKELYYTQIAGVEQPLDSIGILGTEKVRELARKYHADYVLMDRGQLLSLPRAYMNEEYIVYRIQD